jgi:hypothetical protein
VLQSQAVFSNMCIDGIISPSSPHSFRFIPFPVGLQWWGH